VLLPSSRTDPRAAVERASILARAAGVALLIAPFQIGRNMSRGTLARTAGVALLICISASVAAGQQITSTFDTDLEGWTASIGTPEHRTGGNPGGYLYIDNPETQIVELSAPQRFLGNLSSYNRGEFSWDGNILEALDPPYDAEELNYGTVTIFGAGQRVTADLVVGPPPLNTWTTFRVPLESSTFRVSGDQWSAILSNVTAIVINVEAIFGREKQGVDNVVLRSFIQQNLIVEPRTVTFNTDTARSSAAPWKAMGIGATSGSPLISVRETGGQYLEPFPSQSIGAPRAVWVKLKPGLPEGVYQTTILVESIGYDPVEAPVTIRVESEETRAKAILNSLPSVTSRLSGFNDKFLCSLLELDDPGPPDGVVFDKIFPRPNPDCPQSYRISITNPPPGGNILYDKIQFPSGGAASDTINLIRPAKGGLSVTWGDLNFTDLSGRTQSQSREIIYHNNGSEPIRVETSIEQKQRIFSGLAEEFVLQPGETNRALLGFTPQEAPEPGTYQGMIRVKGSDGSALSGLATARIEDPRTADFDFHRAFGSNNSSIIRSGAGLTPAFLYNSQDSILLFESRVSGDTGNTTLTVEPQQGSIPPGQTQSFTITAPSVIQSPGREAVQIFDTNNPNQEAAIFHRFLYPGKSPQGNQLGKAAVNQGACQPDKLLPVMTVPYVNAKLLAGQPVTVKALVLDECGALVSDSQVTVTPDNGDAAFLLDAVGEGEYVANWTPLRSSDTGVSLEVISFSADGGLVGVLSLPVQVVANPDAPPMIEELSTVNAATQSSGTPHSPGELISIYGLNLASATAQAQTLPLPTELGGARVLLGGNPIPLLYASSGQINAMIPFDVTSGVQLSLEVWRGEQPAAPVTLYIAPAVPGVFTQNQTGQGQGIIVDANYQLRNAANPARAGDALVIFLTGLGPTSPPVAAGTAGPGPPFSTTNLAIAVSVGGVNAPVAFAGLAPGFAGLYQVNAVMPSGVTAGDNVPVIVKAGDYAGPAVTIAAR
jgi:uncharacterized protein (TIGR03437 family)